MKINNHRDTGPKVVEAILWRTAYILAMYTGIRALFNLFRHTYSRRPIITRTLPDELRIGNRPHSDAPKSPDQEISPGSHQIWNNQALMLTEHPEDAAWRLRVHARPIPASVPADSAVGMISLWLVDPKGSRLLRLTAHFGCGHWEVAFREEGKVITFFAVRNMVVANASRIHRTAQQRLPSHWLADRSVHLLSELSRVLTQMGHQVEIASPQESVQMAVDNKLLAPARQERVRRLLLRRYERISQQLRCGTPSLPDTNLPIDSGTEGESDSGDSTAPHHSFPGQATAI